MQEIRGVLKGSLTTIDLCLGLISALFLGGTALGGNLLDSNDIGFDVTNRVRNDGFRGHDCILGTCNMTKYSKHQLHLLEHPYHVMYVLPICMLFSRTHVLSKVIELTKSTNVLSPNVFIKIFHTFLPSALPPTQHTQKLNANILTQSQSHPKKQSGTKF